jgi:hypothetical protein
MCFEVFFVCATYPCFHLPWEAEVIFGCAQGLALPFDVLYGDCLFLANLTAPSFAKMH